MKPSEHKIVSGNLIFEHFLLFRKISKNLKSDLILIKLSSYSLSNTPS